MTTNQALSRSETARKKRSSILSPMQPAKPKKSSHQSYHATSSSNNKRGSRSTLSRQGVYQPNRRHLETVYKPSKSKVKGAEISFPTFGPRILSAILIGVMGFFWISLWNSPAFEVTEANLTGNLRLVDSDINAFLSVIGEPVFAVIPEEIEKDLSIIFPEIKSVEVKISLPNNIVVRITERDPVVLWVHPDGSQNWIDILGVAFPIRGEVDQLITVTSYGKPPMVNTIDGGGQTGSPGTDYMIESFIQPALIENIIELSKIAPQGVSISYDPSYGLGWKDPNGWNVYFGENTQDVSMKMNIYQAIVNKLSQQGIQPSMISVEYLDAPFYRTD